jgi:hypothetical protein
MGSKWQGVVIAPTVLVLHAALGMLGGAASGGAPLFWAFWLIAGLWLAVLVVGAAIFPPLRAQWATYALWLALGIVVIWAAATVVSALADR